MWTLTIVLLLSGDPLTLRVEHASLLDCATHGRELEARYLTRPARSYNCTRGRVLTF